jgi:hypothetical protein
MPLNDVLEGAPSFAFFAKGGFLRSNVTTSSFFFLFSSFMPSLRPAFIPAWSAYSLHTFDLSPRGV